MTGKPARNSLAPVEWAVTVLQVVVTIVLAAYLLTYVQQQRERADLVECQSELNTAFREAIAARSDSAAAERAAQRDLLTSAFDQAAITAYLDALAVADRDRANNPVPRDVCG